MSNNLGQGRNLTDAASASTERKSDSLISSRETRPGVAATGSALGNLLSGLTPFFREEPVVMPASQKEKVQDPEQARDARAHTVALARVANYKGLGAPETRETGFKVAQGLLVETARQSGPGASMARARDLVRGYPGSSLGLSLAQAQEAVDRADPDDQASLAFAVDALEAGGIPIPYSMLNKRMENLTPKDKEVLIPLDRNQVSSFIAGVRHALVQAESPTGNRLLLQEESRRRAELAETAASAYLGQKASQTNLLSTVRELAMDIERASPRATPHTLREAADRSDLDVASYVEASLQAPEARMDVAKAGVDLGLDPKMAETLAKTAATIAVQSSALVNQAAFAEVIQPQGRIRQGTSAIDWARVAKHPMVRTYIDQAARAVAKGTTSNPEVRSDLKERFERIEFEFPALARATAERGLDPDSLSKSGREHGLTSGRHAVAIEKGKQMARDIPDALGFASVGQAGVENAGLVVVPSQEGAPTRLIQLSIMGSDKAAAHEVRVLEATMGGPIETFRGPASEIPDVRTRDIAVTAATYYQNFAFMLEFSETKATVPLASEGPKPAGLTPGTSGSILRLLGAAPLGEWNATAVDPRVVVAA